MRYLSIVICLWSSISLFTYTEVLSSDEASDISPHILQIIEKYADIWPDEATL